MPTCGKLKGLRTSTNTGAMSPRSALISIGSLRNLLRLSAKPLLMPSLTEDMVRLASWRLTATPPTLSWSCRTSTTSGTPSRPKSWKSSSQCQGNDCDWAVGCSAPKLCFPSVSTSGQSCFQQPSSSCGLLSASIQ